MPKNYNLLINIMNTPLIIEPDPQDSLAMAVSEKIETLSKMSGSEIFDSLVDVLTKWGLKLLAAIVIYFVGAWLIRKVCRMIRLIFEKRELDPSLKGFVVSFVNVTLIVILFVMVVSILGVPTSTFAALLAAGGLAVGMALSGTLQNFAGGVMILLFKPFKVGDYIEASGFGGTVDAIKITSTQIHTVDNKVVVIPNGTLANGNIQNYSTKDVRRVDWSITISYGDDVEKAKGLLLSLMKSDTRVINEPDPPFAALSALNDSAVVVVARAWCKSRDYWSLFFDMNQKIYDEFPKHELHFPYPQMDVYIKNK